MSTEPTDSGVPPPPPPTSEAPPPPPGAASGVPPVSKERSGWKIASIIVGSFLAFIELVDGSGSRWACAAYVACTVLAAYMSFVSLLVVPAQGLVLLWRREHTIDLSGT